MDRKVKCAEIPKPTPIKQNDRSQAGSSMAWAAILLLALLGPLMGLVIDGSRLFYVRGRLQTATDAACEDAAWSGADYREFRENGTTRFLQNLPRVLAQAQDTFERTLGDRSRVNFSASLAVIPDLGRVVMHCNSSASVPLAVMLGAPVTITAQSESGVRFTN